ncbi:hypothetical protein B4R02_14315 [Salmonella enterica]|nr:hypothetical protein [Salmonella enterica]EBE3720179.1 hypothetical protein [Salmonella enterica subsp. diarizonae serovar 42:l,v:1,5,7]ECO0851122.1 hypothetical protein [Salmonella enterica subsp. enterica serovar Newport]
MKLKIVSLSCVIYITAIWMLLHGIRGYQTGVIIESRKDSQIKDYYYRDDVGFYINVVFYITGGIFLIGFATWFLMTGIGYW